MLKFECENRTLDITNAKETRNFGGGTRTKMLEVVFDGQSHTMDDIEAALTEPDMVTDFTVKNENTGETKSYTGYSINNIYSDVLDGRNSIYASFMKGNS